MVTRYAVITDAAIAVVAEHGMRGLTHRAVDARAALPTGTTSAYYRTRKALIEALVQRLADLDAADLAAGSLPSDDVPAYPPKLTGADLDAIAAATGALLDRWLTAVLVWRGMPTLELRADGIRSTGPGGADIPWESLTPGFPHRPTPVQLGSRADRRPA